MKTSVKHNSKTNVTLTITVGKDELKVAEQVALTKLSKNVKAPGFRKGKVPITVATKYVDPNQLMEGTLDNAVSKAVAEAFIAESIQALARPEVEVKKYIPRSELEFTAQVDIVPAVTLGDYKNLTVATEKVSVTAKEVDDIIDRMRSAQAEKKEADRAAEVGDEVVIDFIGKKDGVPFDGGTAEDYELELGSSSFIPGFEEGIVGMKVGEKKDLKLAFPDTYHVAELAGADVVFETIVKKVNERVLPELTDEFAESMADNDDIKSVKDLKTDIKRELTAQKEREVAERRKDDLVQALVSKSDVEAPQSLIDDQSQSIEQDMRQNMLYRNITLENYVRSQGFNDEDEWRTKEVIPAAEKRVKAGLVLAELSKELKVTASDDEKLEHTNRYKSEYASNPEMVKRFDEPEVQRDLTNRLLTEKTVNQLVDLNTK